MIDIDNEELLSLSEAAGVLPCGRKGRFPDVKTVYAWTTKGCRGVLLESLQLCGRRGTSREAIGRFVCALTNASGTAAKQPRRGRQADTARQKLVAAELDRLGVC